MLDALAEKIGMDPPSEDPRRDTDLGPGDIVTELALPPPPAGLVGSYRKVRARRFWDFALAGVALALVFDGGRVSRARIVLSGAGPVPWRSREAEEMVTGGLLLHDARPEDQPNSPLPGAGTHHLQQRAFVHAGRNLHSHPDRLIGQEDAQVPFRPVSRLGPGQEDVIHCRVPSESLPER